MTINTNTTTSNNKDNNSHSNKHDITNLHTYDNKIDDCESKDINPHIPQYISKTPWYLNQGSVPSLKHQRYKAPESQNSIWKSYAKGKQLISSKEKKKIKWEEGSCKNCGSRTHQMKECTERPRKNLACVTNQDLQPDEHQIQLGDLDYDQKRDRWLGYNPSDYKHIIKQYELIDERRKENKIQLLKQTL